MSDDLQRASDQFENNVPYSDAAFIVLKAHLVVEIQLLNFIKARMSSALFAEVERLAEGSFKTRVLLARALAERDEIPAENADILWPALKILGNVRNDVAHTLEHKGTSLQDKMRSFIATVDPTGELCGKPIEPQHLHFSFHSAAHHLNSLLAIHREPLVFSDEALHPADA